MNSKPLVTCVIPTRDRPNLLRRALDSALKQTYDRIEVIIVVSPPHQPIRQLLKDYNIKDQNINLFYICDKSGANFARNKGIHEASGEYIAFLDDDDVWKPGKIQKQIPYLNHYSIVSCLPTIVKEDETYDIDPSSVVVEKMDINSAFYHYSTLFPSGLIFRTSELEAINGFDEDLRWGEVWDISLKIIVRYDPCYVLNKHLVLFDRKHSQERLSESDGNENLKQASEVYHRHKNCVKSRTARKTLVKLKYSYFREVEGVMRYLYLFSGLRRDYELILLRKILRETLLSRLQ